MVMRGELPSLATNSDRVPGEHVAGALQRVERALERRDRVLGDRLRGPTLAAMNAPQRPRLAHEQDLVAAHGENLPGHPGREFAGEKYRHRRDLLGAYALDALDPGFLFRRLGRNRADHSAPGERRDAIGANVETRHVKRDRFR